MLNQNSQYIIISMYKSKLYKIADSLIEKLFIFFFILLNDHRSKLYIIIIGYKIRVTYCLNNYIYEVWVWKLSCNIFVRQFPNLCVFFFSL